MKKKRDHRVVATACSDTMYTTMEYGQGEQTVLKALFRIIQTKIQSDWYKYIINKGMFHKSITP